MNKYIKIGADLISLDAVSRITFVENQSGISDRILIQVGETVVVVDSDIGGKPRMDAIRAKLESILAPENWDAQYDNGALAPLENPAARAA